MHYAERIERGRLVTWWNAFLDWLRTFSETKSNGGPPPPPAETVGR